MSDRHWTQLAVTTFLVSLGLYAAHVWLYAAYVNDDAYITFRYSRFLAEGLGPYFNAGEHVEGYSNFLWMLLHAAAFRLGGEAAVPRIAKALGACSGGIALIIAVLLVARLTAPLPYGSGARYALGGVAACLIAVFPGFALNAMSGLETGFFAMWIALGTYCALAQQESKRWKWAGLVWAAAGLTRPEGFAAFGCGWGATTAGIFLGSARSERRGMRDHFRWHVLDLGLVVAFALGQLVLRWLLYDGELLPNTYYAKAGGFFGSTAWEYVTSGALKPFLGLPGFLAASLGWAIASRGIGLAAPVAGISAFAIALPFLVGTDWMPGWRFEVPFLVPLAALTVAGWARLAHVCAKRVGPVIWLALPLTVVAAAVLHQAERQELATYVRLRAEGYRTGHCALARWLNNHAHPGDTVALMDIGIVGYYCPQLRILDITGLTDRYIAKRPGRLLQKEYDPAYVLSQEPEFIVIVISALTDPGEPIPENATLGTWTPIESRIMRHPVFQSRYATTRPLDTNREPGWLERLAARIGARRVFPHAFPGQHYLLALFQRNDLPAAP